MNLEQLQADWAHQFDGQPKKEDLIAQLFKEAKLDKVSSKLRKLIIYNVLFMVFHIAVISYAGLVLIPNFHNTPLVITALLMIVLSMIAFFKNVAQLSRLSKIDYSNTIVDSQKQLERLKIQRIQYFRFIFIFSNLYFWLSVTLFFQWNILQVISIVWENAPALVIVLLSIITLWYPFAFWLLHKYENSKHASTFWKRMEKHSFLTDYSVNFSLNQAQTFLHEIEVFEKE